MWEPPSVPDEYRCFHSRRDDQHESVEFDAGTIVDGVVVCQHHYGVGVNVAGHDVWGHVDVTALRVEPGRGLAGTPAIGAHLRMGVLGRTPSGQLKLAVV